MLKWILHLAERLLTTILLVAASMGLFLIGCFVANIFGRKLDSREMTLMALACMALTYTLYCALLRVRYQRLEILADELEQETEESRRLYEHLEVK